MKAKHRQNGFTYVEMGAMIGVTLLLASLIAPNVVTMKARYEDRVFRTKLRALAEGAKAEAIETGNTVGLAYDKGKNEIDSIEEASNGEHRQYDSLALPSGVSAIKFTADKYESPSDGWRVAFYMDGTTSGGGVELDDNGQTMCLVIRQTDSDPRVLNAALPDLGYDRWTAGTYAKRN